MKQLLHLSALCLFLLALGCGETKTEEVKKETAENSGNNEATKESEATEVSAGNKPSRNVVVEVDKSGLESVIAENKVTLIDFTATWCGPCQAMKPWLKKTARNYEGKVKFVAVDVDKSGEVAKEYQIKAMPTLVVLKDGKEVGRVVGAKQSEIKAMIDGAL